MAGKFKSLFEAQDMTVGNPTSSLVKFSIPLLVGNMVQLLYSTVDSIVVGQYVGDEALAAIGVSNPIINLLLLLFMGVAVGGGIMVSQYFGAKMKDKLSGTVGTTITLTIIISIFMMIAGPLVSPPLLKLLGTPDDFYQMACDYLIITFIGILGPAFYNMLAGILRGLGDSLTPLLYLTVACLLNIGLDIWFVAGFHWGVAGAAWATVIAQIVSAIFCLIKLMRMKNTVEIKGRYLKPDKKLVRQLIRLGLPSGATQGIFSLAALVVQGLTNSFGTIVVAVSNVVMRVDSFAMMPNFTFGTAMTTYTGQNIGAQKIGRVEQGAKKGLKIGLLVSVFLVILLLIFGGYLMRMFTDTQEVISLGTRIIRILAAGYVAVAVTQILSGVMRGAGETIVPMWISIVATVITRLPIAYGLAFLTRSAEQPNGSPDSIFISLLISWLAGAVLTVIFYARGKWKNKSVVKLDSLNETEERPDAKPVLEVLSDEG